MENGVSIDSLLKEAENIQRSYGHSNEYGMDYIEFGPYEIWTRKTLMFLQEMYPNHPQTGSFEKIVVKANNDYTNFQILISILSAFKSISPKQEGSKVNYDENLSMIFNRFHILARQIKRRHKNRNTLTIEDEYDVQDLLNGILCLFFDDVRPEEWTPSYAGGCNRIDFLLKDDEIAIEVKMTRDGLKDKELGEQLLIDIVKYRAHPNCKVLYSFVYDPEGFIRNPRGIEKDLDKNSTPEFVVKTFIRPL